MHDDERYRSLLGSIVAFRKENLQYFGPTQMNLRFCAETLNRARTSRDCTSVVRNITPDNSVNTNNEVVRREEVH